MTPPREVPSNTEAEESYVGAFLLSPHKLLDSMVLLSPEDFYRPLYGQIFGVVKGLVSHGEHVDYVTVQNELRGRGVEVELSVLSSLQMNTPGTYGDTRWAQIILEKSDARRTLHVLHDATAEIFNGADPYATAADISKELALLGTPADRAPEATTLSYLEGLGDAASPVIIPGILRQDWRTIVVGSEGSGKSVLCRSMAIATSQGHHPFWFTTKIVPMRVLLVDLENPVEAILETGGKFMNFIRERDPEIYDEERLKIWRRPGGINLRNQRDRADLQREIIAHQPDLVVLGPVYKAYARSSSESYEEAAFEFMDVLDKLRERYEFGLILEHHAAKGAAGQKREMNPFGSQRFLAWPEAGISLYADKADPRITQVRRFRGDRLSSLCWPDQILRDPNTIITGRWDDRAPDAITTSTR
jgi:hypothetical protein